MTFEQGRIPPGPAEKYDTSEDPCSRSFWPIKRPWLTRRPSTTRTANRGSRASVSQLGHAHLVAVPRKPLRWPRQPLRDHPVPFPAEISAVQKILSLTT